MAVKDPSAPGDLDRVRRFVNSTHRRLYPSGHVAVEDHLATPESAAAWLRENGLLEGSERLDLAAAQRLREFREALRLALLSHTGEADPSAGWEQVRDLGQHVTLRMCLGPTPGETSLAATGTADQQAIGRLLAAIYDALRTGTWRRLKVCRQHTCLWAFYDHSKNGSGAWCDMAVCGNRAKAQRRRQRSATKSPATEL
jgi:predicted RNA-binding Zn ribbon-like protein